MRTLISMSFSSTSNINDARIVVSAGSGPIHSKKKRVAEEEKKEEKEKGKGKEAAEDCV